MRRGTVGTVLVAAMFAAVIWAADAGAQVEQRGIDPNQGLSLVEVNVPNKGAAMRLQLEAESYGVQFNEHYLRHNRYG